MNKLLTRISVICFAGFGFANVSLAGTGVPVIMPLELDCNQVGIACIDNKTYEVELNCMDIDDTIEGGRFDNDGFLGDLEVKADATWDLDVQWTEDVAVPDFVDVCDASGDIESLLKHEMKCTDAPQGSNKTGKNKDAGFAQVDFEIKYEGEDCYLDD